MRLWRKLEERLRPSKFRIINEMLHDSAGRRLEKTLIIKYHEDFRLQSRRWPERPFDLVRCRLQDNWDIVDVGCGEAELSGHFSSVISLDLYATNAKVIECNMCSIPLKEECADAVVFCLSLMQEDIHIPIKESNRILRTTGKLLIAEAISRTASIDKFAGDVESVGFKTTYRYSNGYFVILEFSKTSGQGTLDNQIHLKKYKYRKR